MWAFKRFLRGSHTWVYVKVKESWNTTMVTVMFLYSAFSVRICSNTRNKTLRGNLATLHWVIYNIFEREFCRCHQLRNFGKQSQKHNSRSYVPYSLLERSLLFARSAWVFFFLFSTSSANQSNKSSIFSFVIFKTLSVGPVWGLNPWPPRRSVTSSAFSYMTENNNNLLTSLNGQYGNVTLTGTDLK